MAPSARQFTRESRERNGKAMFLGCRVVTSGVALNQGGTYLPRRLKNMNLFYRNVARNRTAIEALKM